MKIRTLSCILFCLLFGACNKYYSNRLERNKYSVRKSLAEIYTKEDGSEWPIDSVLLGRNVNYFNTLTEGHKNALLYSETNVSIQHGNRHYVNNKCQASLEKDTLTLWFNRKFEEVIWAWPTLKIQVTQDYYAVEIMHVSDHTTIFIMEDGSYVNKPFPCSIIMSFNLELNSSSYEIGDTLKGRISGRSINPDSGDQEIIEGIFRAIVE